MERFKISRALGLSFKAWFRNFIPFTLLAAVLYSPVLFWILTIEVDPGYPEDALDVFFTYPVYALTAVSTLFPPLFTYRVVQQLNDTKVSMWTSIKFGLRGCIPAILLAVVLALIELLPVGGSILGVIVTCVFFVVTPAAVAERCGPLAAFRRSEELTRGRRWGIFGLVLLLSLCVGALMAIWIVPALDTESSIESVRMTAILFTAVLVAAEMLTGIAQAVSYALLRQDKDGVSHAELARIFE